MRIEVSQHGALFFDSGLRLEPPLLLAFPFAALTLIAGLSGSYSLSHAAGIAVLTCITALCLLLGVKRTRVEVRPESQQVFYLRRRTARLTPNAKLVLAQAPSNQRGLFELTVVDGSSFRQVLLSSSLASVLDQLEIVRRVWPIPVEFEFELCPTFARKPQGKTWLELADKLELTSTTTNQRAKLAGVLAAVSLVAFVVVSVLVRKQVQSGGPISPLGWGLCALLVLAPAITCAHIWRGRVKLCVEAERLRIDHYPGLIGARHISISRGHLFGLWAVRIEGAQHSELLWCEQGHYGSIPVAERDLEHWCRRLNLPFPRST